MSELENHVPIRDPFTLDGLSRKITLQETFLDRTAPDADTASFGIVAFVLFVAGSLAALVRWNRGGMQVAGWSAGVVAFLLFFHAMQQWHPYAFRYFVLAAPWVAVVSAWGIEQLRGTARVAVWVLVLAASAEVCWSVTTRTHQSGLRAVTRPERSLTYFVSDGWGRWSDGLEPEAAPPRSPSRRSGRLPGSTASRGDARSAPAESRKYHGDRGGVHPRRTGLGRIPGRCAS